MARISETSGIEMRVFARDANLDIMQEFLKDGQYQSLPVAVFYTRDHQYIGHWIERPAMADQDRAQIQEAVKQDLPEADEQKVRAETRTRQQERYPIWQQASVQEMRELVARHLNLG